MLIMEFLDWLIEYKHMKQRSAKDVLSRCKRVTKLLNIDEFDENTTLLLAEKDEFQNSPTSIRSQLKRAVNLYLEFSAEQKRAEEICLNIK